MTAESSAPLFRGWRAVRTDDGSYTLAHPTHGETCHSVAGAWQESWERYAVSTGLPDVARGTRVALLDVGTGLGLNLAAALAALEGCTLVAVSLEHDEGVLRAALELGAWLRASGDDARLPAPLARWHPVVLAAIERALATNAARVPLAGGELELRIGDARATLRELALDQRFDAVFFDPFSRTKEPALWALDVLADVAARMAPNARLATYSASLEVRARLVAGGLHVGPLARVGSKAQGTIAVRADGATDAAPPFDPRTRRRLERRVARLQSPGGNSHSSVGLGTGD
ncbi:MAG: MnmC family methyltransferase [Planctomycetota bacterium]